MAKQHTIKHTEHISHDGDLGWVEYDSLRFIPPGKIAEEPA